ncbi:hypothetical protein [Halovulum dunhuangense]|nr:hypothetical protein [Halovulum dunhuangense]
MGDKDHEFGVDQLAIALTNTAPAAAAAVIGDITEIDLHLLLTSKRTYDDLHSIAGGWIENRLNIKRVRFWRKSRSACFHDQLGNYYSYTTSISHRIRVLALSAENKDGRQSSKTHTANYPF